MGKMLTVMECAEVKAKLESALWYFERIPSSEYTVDTFNEIRGIKHKLKVIEVYLRLLKDDSTAKQSRGVQTLKSNDNLEERLLHYGLLNRYKEDEKEGEEVGKEKKSFIRRLRDYWNQRRGE